MTRKLHSFFCFSYEATEDKAKYFRDTFRSQLPALYNAAREFEAPIPRTSPPSSPIDTFDATLDFQFNIENVSVGNENPNEGENDEQNDERIEESIENEPQCEESIEDKPQLPLPNVVLNESDSLAVDNMFGDENEAEEVRHDEHDGGIAGIVLQANETSFYENGILKVTRRYSDDMEFTYTYGENTKPFPLPRYVVKRNDIVSKNYPFEENVCVSGQSEDFYGLI